MTATNTLSAEEGRIYRDTGALPARMQTEAEKKCAAKVERLITKAEKDLQRVCERWAESRGYMRMTPENAENITEDQRGWQGHLNAPKRNPLFPDLPLFELDMRRCLPIEFKVRDRYQPGQLALIEAGIWIECRTFDGFTHEVLTWELHI